MARRANALLLLDDGKSRAEIAGVLYLDDDTVRGWRKQYLAEGRDTVAHDGWKGGQSRMTGAQGAGPCIWLEGRICRSAHEIRAHIRAGSGIRHSHSSCLKLLARLGLEYRKPRAAPRAADAGEQAGFIAFYENLLASPGADGAVYFADAVHPEYQTKPAFGRVKRGSNLAVKTTAGRAPHPSGPTAAPPPAPQPDRAAPGRHAPIRHAEPIRPDPGAMRDGHLDVLSGNNPQRE